MNFVEPDVFLLQHLWHRSSATSCCFGGCASCVSRPTRASGQSINAAAQGLGWKSLTKMPWNVDCLSLLDVVSSCCTFFHFWKRFNHGSQFDSMIIMLTLRSLGWEHDYMAAPCGCSCNVLCMLVTCYMMLFLVKPCKLSVWMQSGFLFWRIRSLQCTMTRLQHSQPCCSLASTIPRCPLPI